MIVNEDFSGKAHVRKRLTFSKRFDMLCDIKFRPGDGGAKP